MRVERSVLIVAPARHTGDWLRRLIERTLSNVEIRHARSFSEAQTLLTAGEPFQHIFVSNKFSEREIAEFIEFARTAPAGRESAFILLFGSSERDSSLIAKCMMIGIHGFLGEPCSEHHVAEAMQVATGMRRQTSETRLRAASTVMVSGLVNEFLSGTYKVVKDIREVNINEYLNRCRAKYHEVTGESVTTTVVSTVGTLPRAQRILAYERLKRKIWQVFHERASTVR
ncbi:MAG: hypothetical protein KDD69_17480 [Bdellovibrionales bacterium]|nr:hypothetical protein [Bdellovibrionales bacterium]